MIEKVGIVTLSIIVINGLFSYKGFNDAPFFEKYLFQVNKILHGKEYIRLITSGFLHTDWAHLLFNMFSFYSFGDNLEGYLGPVKFLVIYFASLLGGDILALILHQKQGSYRAVGASGAVCGVIFAAIALFPGIEIGFIFIPVPIPGWIFGIGYALYTIYGIKSNLGNIGHEAHLGGAIIGLATAVALKPDVLEVNLVPILLIAAPSVLFILILIIKPSILLGRKQ
jgi:membrane associated rhomboid family serine protease